MHTHVCAYTPISYFVNFNTQAYQWNHDSPFLVCEQKLTLILQYSTTSTYTKILK